MVNKHFRCHQLSLLGLLVAPLLYLLLGCSRSRASSPPAPLPSPDGRWLLVTSINASHADPATYGCVHFVIEDKTGRVVYQQQTHAADRMRWDMAWQGNEAVVLHSSDIGNFSWQRQHSGRWAAVGGQ